MRSELLKTIEAYNSSAKAYAESIARLNNYDTTYRYFADCIEDNAFVLDLACGPANISSTLVKHKLLRITGLDLSQNMVELARKNIPEGNFFCGDIIKYQSEYKYDAAVIGFAIPYLTLPEIEELLENTGFNLNSGGYLYISFMLGESQGYEVPSFNRDVEFYIHYYSKSKIEKLLRALNFELIKEWELDYQEMDGSITTDVVIVARKS